MDTIIHWVRENYNVISVVANTAMLFVWLFYAQLFYKEFREQRHVLIVIHQAQGFNPGSLCLVINMSKEPVHVLSILATAVHRSKGTITRQITDYQRLLEPHESQMTVENILHQGPLTSGDFLFLGTFRHIVRHLASDCSGMEEVDHGDRDYFDYNFLAALEYIDIQVVAIHGARSLPVGAYRRFNIVAEEGMKLCPATALTQQMTSRRERQRVYQWLELTLRV